MKLSSTWLGFSLLGYLRDRTALEHDRTFVSRGIAAYSSLDVVEDHVVEVLVAVSELSQTTTWFWAFPIPGSYQRYVDEGL